MKPTQACRPENLHYLKMLARQYPTVQAASTEIINLQAILNLPKGTEHFVSDVHGEYEAFLHILNSASGVVREKLDDLFAATVSKAERDQLATLIYYPKEKLEEIQRETPDMREWYRITFHRLIGDLPPGQLQVHPLQGAQGHAQGVRLHHRRDAAHSLRGQR